ncbi:MAG: hypothetical protein R3B97_08980 [Dehalococcoidia bacterium]|nr:hypothetical protein [Dehalococcoidia bacterium]MCB9486545.1 hypothetical protein [Thermoflexaceae bacterium]
MFDPQLRAASRCPSPNFDHISPLDMPRTPALNEVAVLGYDRSYIPVAIGILNPLFAFAGEHP